MGLLESIIGSGVGKLIKDVVGTFHLSPEAKLEFDKAIAENEFQLKKLDTEYETRLLETQSKEVEIASANIRAESANGDKYTSRARPTFLYIMEAILMWNFVAMPLFGKIPIVFPDPLFWLFGSCMLGYTGARTWEKLAGAK